jgi:hypothetical protein
MNNKKMTIIFILIFIVIIIIIALSILLLQLNKEKKENEEELIEQILYENIEKVTNKSTFYRTSSCINKYIDYIKLQDEQAYKSINEQVEIKKEYNTNAYFYCQEMYSIDKSTNITVFVKGYIRDEQLEEMYYIVNLDYNNDTFNIIESTKEEFDSSIEGQVDQTYKEDIYVKQNEYNQIPDSITDFEILQSYFEDFKWKAMYNYPKAFELLDEEYKKAKFNNDLQEFKTYLQNNIATIQDANIIKHSITQEGSTIKYVIGDNFGNTYTIIETESNTYTISLDTYTVEDDELKQQYNSLSNEEKAASNIDKIMKLINQKEYSTVYSYLNTEFKNTNFPTLESFTSYVKQNFFDNNIIGSISVGSEGSIYMVSVPFKESLSSAADEKTKTFIVQLNEGTDFEISFEI